MVIWQLLYGYCLNHPMLCDCDIEDSYVFQNDSAEKR